MKKSTFFERLGEQKPSKKHSYINYALLVVLVLMFSANQLFMAGINSSLGSSGDGSSLKSFFGFVSSASEFDLDGDIVSDSIKLVIPTGIPAIYGEELGVSFDSVQQSINVLKAFDPSYGKQKITPVGVELKRYIDVGLRISCEYCCSAKSIIRSNGDAACGCAHSQAMRGLLSYLINNHGDEYTNDELLRELARWKGTYFPKQMIQKISTQLQGGQEFTPDTAALILDMELPDYGSGKSAPLPSEIKDLPSMVGGC
jgi:hypothetical protein